MNKTPKSDQLRAMREARHADTNRGLRVSPPAPRNPDDEAGDGVMLESIAHPPGLIDDIADAIQSGKLSLKKRGRPRKTEDGFDKAAWQREYMRKKRAKEGK